MPGTPANEAGVNRANDWRFVNDPRLHTTFGFRVQQLTEQLAVPEVSVMPSVSYNVAPYTLELQSICPGILSITKSNHPPQVIKGHAVSMLRTMQHILMVLR